MVLLIGWRGEPSVSDEPQHGAQGLQMIRMLESCEIESLDTLGAANTIEKAADIASAKKYPVAVLIRRGILADTSGMPPVSHVHETPQNDTLMCREASDEVLDLVGNSDDFIISTMGYTSRESCTPFARSGAKIPSARPEENSTRLAAWDTRYRSRKASLWRNRSDACGASTAMAAYSCTWEAWSPPRVSARKISCTWY